MEKKSFHGLDAILIFLCVLFKYLIVYGISKSVLYTFIGVLAFLVLIDVCSKSFSKEQYINITIFLGISMFFVIIYQDVNFLISFLLAMLCINKNEKDFVKAFFISSVILYVLTILLNEAGLLTSKNMYRVTQEDVLIRYSLGFNHPNEVFLFFIPIAFAGYYLYSDKKAYYVCLIVASTILYEISYSRTGYITIICIIVLHLLRKSIMKLNLNKVMPYILILLTFISIGMAKVYGKDFDNEVSDALSQRPYYWNYYLENDKMFTLMGKNQEEEIYIDNFYIYLLVELGLVGYAIYFVVYSKALNRLVLDEKVIVIALGFFIYGLSETNVIIGSINFLFAIMLKSLIVCDGGKDEKESIDINYNSGV